MITTTFVEANGLRFEVDQCGDGNRLALFLHGFPERKESWRFHVPELAELGYTCWAPNLRGYGQSSRPTRRRDYRLEHLLADVAGLIDAARAQGVDGPVTRWVADPEVEEGRDSPPGVGRSGEQLAPSEASAAALFRLGWLPRSRTFGRGANPPSPKLMPTFLE